MNPFFNHQLTVNAAGTARPMDDGPIGFGGDPMRNIPRPLAVSVPPGLGAHYQRAVRTGKRSKFIRSVSVMKRFARVLKTVVRLRKLRRERMARRAARLSLYYGTNIPYEARRNIMSYHK